MLSEFEPASPRALERGCECSTKLNPYVGGNYAGEFNEKHKPVFKVNLDCPIHGYDVIAKALESSPPTSGKRASTPTK